MDRKIADLSGEKLEKLREMEYKLGVVLVAYEDPPENCVHGHIQCAICNPELLKVNKS